MLGRRKAKSKKKGGLQKKPVQNASALEKLAAAHQSVFAPHSQGICVASIMPIAVQTLRNELKTQRKKLT